MPMLGNGKPDRQELARSLVVGGEKTLRMTGLGHDLPCQITNPTRLLTSRPALQRIL